MSTTFGSAAVAAKDAWHTFVDDVDHTIQRVGGLSPTLEILRMVIKGDILPMIRDTMRNMIELRDAVYPAISAMADHLDDIEDRMSSFEGLGTDTQLLPEDAELIHNLAEGTKLILTETLKVATGEMKTKLEELIAIADKCELMATDKVIDVEPDEDGDDDGGEDVLPDNGGAQQ